VTTSSSCWLEGIWISSFQIWTYSVAGAQFGYSLLWVMIPTTIALVVVQEMASRMGEV